MIQLEANQTVFLPKPLLLRQRRLCHKVKKTINWTVRQAKSLIGQEAPVFQNDQLLEMFMCIILVHKCLDQMVVNGFVYLKM